MDIHQCFNTENRRIVCETEKKMSKKAGSSPSLHKVIMVCELIGNSITL